MTLPLPITLPPWCPCAPTAGHCEGMSLQTSGSSARARKLEDTASSWVAGIHFLCHLLVCCQAVSVSVFERGKCSGARHFRRNVPPLNNPRRKMCKVNLRSPRDPQEGLELKNPGEIQIYGRDHHEHEESYLQLSCSDECCSQITQQKNSRKEFPESHWNRKLEDDSGGNQQEWSGCGWCIECLEKSELS